MPICLRLLVVVCLLALASAGCPDDKDQPCYKNKWMFQLHACFMAIGWGLILPWGAAIAMYRRHVGKAGGGKHHAPKIFKNHASFYTMHRNLQMVGFLFVIAGFVTIYLAMPKVWGEPGKKYDPGVSRFYTETTSCKGAKSMWSVQTLGCHNPHTKLGIAIICLMIFQVAFGVVHHLLLGRFNTASGNGASWVRPVLPSYIHVYLGWTLVVLALINCAFGCDMYGAIYDKVGNGSRARTFGVPFFLAMLALVVVVNLLEQVKLWKFAGHCCPFKDGDNSIRCCPVPIHAKASSTPAPTTETDSV